MNFDTTPLLSATQIQRRVAELAAQISDDYAGEEVLLMPVLAGGLIFASDLMRSLSVPVSLDFIRARSYRQTTSTGRVEFVYHPQTEIEGRHVLVVEDILDTGRTAAAIMDYLRERRPASLGLCTLLDKPARRLAPISAQYVGFTIPDHFVIGYGLDYDQRGRELPDIRILNTM
jgi:hypoxanthine phosphoribosyltransferase